MAGYQMTSRKAYTLAYIIGMAVCIAMTWNITEGYGLRYKLAFSKLFIDQRGAAHFVHYHTSNIA